MNIELRGTDHLFFYGAILAGLFFLEGDLQQAQGRGGLVPTAFGWVFATLAAALFFTDTLNRLRKWSGTPASRPAPVRKTAGKTARKTVRKEGGK